MDGAEQRVLKLKVQDELRRGVRPGYVGKQEGITSNYSSEDVRRAVEAQTAEVLYKRGVRTDKIPGEVRDIIDSKGCL